MRIAVFALVRVHGTTKNVIIGCREINATDPDKTLDAFCNLCDGEFMFSSRYGCDENLRRLDRGRNAVDSGYDAIVTRDARNLITETRRLVNDVLIRYDLEPRDVMFSFIRIKGSKDDECQQ